MAIHKDSIVNVDLTSGTIHRSFLNHSIGMNDSDGDFFGVRVFKDGAPVDLTNVSVQGHFNPPVGAPIFLNAGNYISGNVATVRLPQACYNYEGPFSLAIKLVTVNETVTVRIVDGMVDNTYVEGSVAPTGTVPTYQEVLAEYDQMVAATATANAAAQTAVNTANAAAQTAINTADTAAANCAAIVAAPYSNSATYAVGTYCTKDGKLYECTTAITTAEEWTAGHWTETKVGPEVSDLKSALSYVPDSIEAITGNNFGIWKSGYYTTPAVGSAVSLTASSNWITTLIPVTAGDKIYIDSYGGSSVSRQYVYIDSEWKATGSRAESGTTGAKMLTAPANAVYVAVNNRLENKPSGFYAVKSLPIKTAMENGFASVNENMTNTNTKIDNTASDIRREIASITGNTIYVFTDGKWIDTSSTVDRTALESHAGAACAVVPCQEGDEFTITGHGFTSSHMLWTFIDSDGVKKKSSGSNVSTEQANIIAPVNAVYLVVNVNTSYTYELFKGKVVSQIIRTATPSMEDIRQYEDENGKLLAGTYSFTAYPETGNLLPLLVNVQAKYDSGETTSVPYINVDCFAKNGQRIYYGHRYYFASDKQYVKQAWRFPNCFEVGGGGRIAFHIIVPEGTTLDIKFFESHYDTSVRKGTGNIVFHAHRGFDKLLPPGAYNAYVAASELGFQSCIEIPKFTSDGVAVCFHNDGGSSSKLSNVFTMPDGSAVSALTDSSKISDFTYAELMQWSIGYVKNPIFADAKISTMDDFLRICAETGMRPIFSIHPNPTAAQWAQLKTLLDKYRLTKWLSVKSGDTAVWKNVIDTFGDGNIYSIINIVGTTSTYNILTKIANGRSSSGAVTTRIDVEFFDEGLKSATYGSAQHEMLAAAVDAGYVASVVLDNGTTGNEMKGYMNLGVSEFTNCRHASIGLNW